MTSFFIFIIESAISLSAFYIFYELFLKRDTWFRFNRYFLLFGLIFSCILPILDFSVTGVVVNSQNQFEFSDYLNMSSSVNSFEYQAVNWFYKPDFIPFLYIAIVSIFLIRLLFQIIQLYKTINANEIINYKNYKLVLLNNSSSPFSFFNYIFIDKDDYRDGSNELLLHEITHAQQKHSIDVILLEMILVFQWFNPFIYRYRQAFKEIHEYLADSGVLKANNDKIAYQRLIIDQIEKSFHVRLASQFNYSLTKKRIKMMTRINSSKLAKFKTLLIIPLIALLLMAFSMKTSTESFLNTNQVLQTPSDSKLIPSIFPVKKGDGVEVSSGFGMRIHPISKKEMMHNAVDIKAPVGTPVYATANGKVRKVEQDFKIGEGYGKYIIIDHEGGYSTLYAQLSEYYVTEGKEVNQGDVIGYVGQTGLSTGPHLHYEVMKDGENLNPEDYF
ncbi:MAG: peptidoglycan DD-metalloendopeptidase family protein [Bacteroidales bacterium]